MTRSRIRQFFIASAGPLAIAACASEPRHRPKLPSVEKGDATAASVAVVAASSTAAADGALAQRDFAEFARALATVSAMRGVASTRAVPGVKLTREELVLRVKEKALREYPPEALRREGQFLQLLGFAPVTFDYLAEILKLLGTQLEGFYEPNNGTMYLAADLKGPQAEATLAHELVHALQDQTWDLRKRSDYKSGRGDESMALACVAEGDATSLMLDFVMGEGRSALDINDDALREMILGGMTTGDGSASVPHILRSSLVAPYLEGLGFVHALRRKGGWRNVDRVWERLPTTTEQVLHPLKWEANEAALAIQAPTAHALGMGWREEDQDTSGELGLALTFAEWMTEPDARAAAAGWGGDRSAAYKKGQEIAYAVHVRYDAAVGPSQTDANAERAFAKLAPALTKKFGRPSRQSAGALCFDRKELGPLSLLRRGQDLVMTAGPAKVASEAGQPWESTSRCSTVTSWASEVAAQK